MQQNAGEQSQQKQCVVAAGLMTSEHCDQQENQEDEKCEVQAYRNSQQTEALHRSGGLAISQRSYPIHTLTITKQWRNLGLGQIA